MLLVAPGPRPPQRPDPRGFDSGIVLRDELLSAWSLLGPVQHGLRTLGTPAALEALAALPAIAGEIDGAVARWAQGDDDALPALEAAAALVCLGLGYERMGGLWPLPPASWWRGAFGRGDNLGERAYEAVLARGEGDGSEEVALALGLPVVTGP